VPLPKPLFQELEELKADDPANAAAVQGEDALRAGGEEVVG
jgi:hypothetical protein